MPKKNTPTTASNAPPAVSSAKTAASVAKRDDFKKPVKVLLAQRVGYLCSNPECQAPTIGPRMGEAGAANVGVAAHIKAAAKGPRYDEHQTPEERSGFDNGIWLCQTHAALIDRDEKTFPVELLQKWKKDAEQRAFDQLLSGQGPAKVYRAAAELADQVAELRTLLALPTDTDVDSVRARVAVGSRAQVEAFERSERWPRHLVQLELAADAEGGTGRLSLERFGQLLSATQKIVLVSPPGTGKSTTLVQIARQMLTEGPVPAIVPLGEWAEASSDLFAWLVNRHGYEGLSVNHLKFLAHQGELALLLDGYNEVPADVRVALMQELKGLLRDYPLMGVVMSSRRETRNLPLPGHRLVVMPLSDDQQLEIASAMRGKDGASVLDAAWRTPGLADLVTIPLYLRSLLELTPGTTLPETKEEVLRGLVRTHEAAPEAQEVLHQLLLGEQQRYLTSLAVAAQQLGSPTLPEAAARHAVAAVNRALMEEGLTTSPLPVPQVLDLLVASHALVRDAGGTFSFQHQQIQEWYASLECEVALDAVGVELTMTDPFAVERLDNPDWGEVIFFTCERMARRDAAGAAVVARVIEVLLSIDPLFAAKVISRSGEAVWAQVAVPVLTFASAWHASKSMLAVAFMIESRRREFADLVWPLVSGGDGNQMPTMRLVRRFNPGVLGDRLMTGYAGLPNHAREALIVELAHDGDRAGIDAAYQLALTEPDFGVRRRVFEGFTFRRATSQMEGLLRQSGEELLDDVARRGYWDGVRDKELLADLQARRKRLVVADSSPERRLSEALHTFSVADPATVAKLLQRFLAARRQYEANAIRSQAAYHPVDRVAKVLGATRASVLFAALRQIEHEVTAGDIDALASVISRHGHDAEREGFWLNDVAERAAAVAMLNRWGERLLQEGGTRHDMAQLTWAMKRLPDSSQVPVVASMLAHDLAARARSRAAFEANRRDDEALQDTRWSHEHEFRTLLTDIGTSSAENVLTNYLTHPDFGIEAAIGLQVIWRQRHEPSANNAHFQHFPDFERAAQLRAAGPRATVETADQLLAVAEALLMENTPKAIARAAQVAGNAVLLPHGERQAWFNSLLEADMPDRVRLDLARRMVAGGLVVPSTVILTRLNALVVKHGERNWVHESETWEYTQWIELLPASDRPAALLDGLDLIASFRFGHWRLRDALAGLRLLPEAEHVALVRGILQRYPDFGEQYEFYRSLRNPGAPTLDLLIDIAAGKFGQVAMHKGARFDYPDELYNDLREAERSSLVGRFEAAANDPARIFLGRLLLASGDHGAFVRLCQTKIGRHIIRHESYRTLEKLLYLHQPISQDGSSYELVPRSVEELRKQLFHLTFCDDTDTAAFAADYLGQIDRSRSEEGAVDSGARHPDIRSGRPWPVVAVAAAATV